MIEERPVSPAIMGNLEEPGALARCFDQVPGTGPPLPQLLKSRRGEQIWEEDHSEHPREHHQTLLVVKGAVLQYRIYAGKPIPLALLGPGDVVFPTPGIPHALPIAARAMALLDTEYFQMPLRQVQVAEQIRSAQRLLDMCFEVTALDAAQRLAGLLLRLSAPVDGASTAVRQVECRQELLAWTVGARRETLAVMLSKWADADWISTRYGRIIVRDAGVEELERIKRGGQNR